MCALVCVSVLHAYVVCTVCEGNGDQAIVSAKLSYNSTKIPSKVQMVKFGMQALLLCACVLTWPNLWFKSRLHKHHAPLGQCLPGSGARGRGCQQIVNLKEEGGGRGEEGGGRGEGQ